MLIEAADDEEWLAVKLDRFGQVFSDAGYAQLQQRPAPSVGLAD
ncbi:hypothetical protein QJS66_02520 [Kocuria rhizophila]|nr:hypothetical protein QJS66_02520 [Kocuria rhizophila]